MIEIVYVAIKYMTWVKYDGWVMENATMANSLIINIFRAYIVIVKLRNHEIFII